jgi:hypothetical protein
MNNPEIDIFGTKRWYNSKGQIHRDDGPAVESREGYKGWFQNNELHREDGPAQENRNGREMWWINGKRIE